MANRFFVGDVDDDWDDGGNWAASSGGAGGAGVPGTTDAAILDGNSPNVTMNSNVEVQQLSALPFTNTWDWNNFNFECHSGFVAPSSGTLLNIGTLVLDIDVGGTFSFNPNSFTYNTVFVDNSGAVNQVVQVLGTLNCSILAIRTLSTGEMSFDANSRIFNITSNFNVQQFSSGVIEIIDSGTATWNITGTIVDLEDLDVTNSDLSNFKLIENNILFTPPSFGTLVINELTIDNTNGTGIARTFTFKDGNIECERLFLIANNVLDGDIVIDASTFDFDIRINREFDRDTAAGVLVTLKMGNGLWEYGPADSGKNWPLFDTLDAGNSELRAYSGVNAFSIQHAAGQSFWDVSVTCSDGIFDTNGGNGGFVDFGVVPFKVDNELRFLNVSGGSDTDTEFKTIDEITVAGDFTIITNGSEDISLTLNHRIKVAGDVAIISSTGGIGAQAGLLKELELNGTVTQTVTNDFWSSQIFTKIIVTNTSDTTIVFDDAIDIDELVANASTLDIIIKFKEGVTHVIDTLTLSGVLTNHVILKSKVDGTQWGLTVTAGQIVNHVDVKDSDASTSAAKINATDKTNIDSGNNIFWAFAPAKTTRVVYDYNGITKNTKRIVYDYSAFFAKITRVIYDYSGLVKTTERVVYDYLKRNPDNVRIILNPYSQDSVRLNWAGFVPPANYSGEFFYGVYIEGEPYEVDIQPDQTWMDVVGLVDLECVIIDVVIQTFFGQRFTFDFEALGDRIKVTFKESSDPNIFRYVFYGDAGDGSIDFTKEIGEIIVGESKKDVNTGFIPEGS